MAGGNSSGGGEGCEGAAQGGTGARQPQQDFLGYGVYADTLWARIVQALNRDAPTGTTPGAALGDDPLVIGIFGEWGAGKSKLLALVRERAQDLARQRQDARSGKAGGGGDAGFGLTVPVFFQPWKYEHEPHLLVPLMLHILAALKATAREGQTLTEKLKQQGDAHWPAVLAAMPKIIDGVELLVKSTAVAMAGASAPAAGFSMARVLAKLLPGQAAGKDGKPADPAPAAPATPPDMARDLTYTDDGRFYYEMHEALKDVTRPQKQPRVLPGVRLDQNIRINFAVFIDDLDRCLPEKAVEALELIKTVFNLESFAFVLALDEEVVERGIGHRYKDYQLAGRKPEMPITGFEYLEKIVHLPFRLPALTRPQAAAFVRAYEARQPQPDGMPRWFSPGVWGDDSGAPQARETPSEPQVELLDLALDSFDVYVPRKLIRMVELMQQTAAVAARRARPLDRQPGGAIDARVVLALAMVQLFQPELYRLMRRRPLALPTLLAAFAPAYEPAPAPEASDDQRPWLGSVDVADVDLWRWVAWESRLPHGTAADAQTAHDPVARIQQIRDGSLRWLAQQVRLPIVAQLVEYRAAQRHGFDVLKLMHALAQSLHQSLKEHPSGTRPEAMVIAPYLSLLGNLTDDTVPTTAGLPPVVQPTAASLANALITVAEPAAAPPTDTRPRHRPRDQRRLFEDLVSPEEAVQANIVSSHELPEGQVLTAESAADLLERARVWLKTSPTPDPAQALERLARGLRYLAPWIPREHGPDFWALVKSQAQGSDELGQPLDSVEAVKRRDQWADLRSTLGADDRFDPGFFYLPRHRFPGHDERSEPIPGFVRVGHDPDFRQAAGDELPGPSQPFYIARYLTTVDQYAAFVADGGYQDTERWWDSQGLAWRQGEWASKIEGGSLRELLDSPTLPLRQQPMEWARQQAHGSRPVHGINCFEARAYARWLDAQLRKRLGEAGLSGCQVLLPVEAQWERAARALSASQADSRPWPWGSDEASVPWRANVDATGLKRVSVTGLFESNSLGVSDLAGNLREWQDNLYEDQAPYKVSQQRIPRLNADRGGKKSDWLVTHEELDRSARPAVRGGSWINPPKHARCSYRSGVFLTAGTFNLGFRVVLSLAESGL